MATSYDTCIVQLKVLKLVTNSEIGISVEPSIICFCPQNEIHTVYLKKIADKSHWVLGMCTDRYIGRRLVFF